MKHKASELTNDLKEYFDMCGLGDLAHYWNEIIGPQRSENVREEDIVDL